MVSKYETIKIELRNKIESGQLKSGDKLPTEKELCEQYSTSSITVIKALNELCHEGLLFRRRGSGTFVKDKESTPIKKGTTIRIGVLWKIHLNPKNLLHEYFGQITQGILESFNLSMEDTQWKDQVKKESLIATWKSDEFSVIIEAISEANEDNTKTPPIELVKEKQFDGLITIGIIQNDYLEQLVNLGIPVVITDYLNSIFDFKADQIYTDPIPAYQNAIDFFVKQNATKIHFIGGYIGVPAPKRNMKWNDFVKAVKGKKHIDPDSFLRLGAYRQVLQKANIKIPDSWIHFIHYEDMSDLELAKFLFNLEEKDIPEAIICHTYPQAAQIMKYFSENGRYVLATGISNTKRGGPAFPIIATGKELGLIAVDILISKIQKPKRLTLRIGVPLRFDQLQGQG